MTIWKKGMMAVCIADGWVKSLGGDPVKDELLKVSKVGYSKNDIGRKESNCTEGLSFVGKKQNVGWAVEGFRPAVLDHQEQQSKKANKLDDILKGRIPA